MAARKRSETDRENRNAECQSIIPQNEKDVNRLIHLIEEILGSPHIRYRLSSLPTGDGSELSSIVAEVFLRLRKDNWAALRRIKLPDALRAYVRRIAERILQDRFRGSNVTRDLNCISYEESFNQSEESADVASVQQKSRSPAEQLEAKEKINCIYKAIESIRNRRHRKLLFLVAQGLKVGNAARKLGLSTSAAYSALSRYRTYLRKELQHLFQKQK